MAVVVSEGQLVGLSRTEPSVSRSVWLGNGNAETYQAMWRSQPQVRTVVGFLARNIAQLGLHVYERVSDVDRQRANDHPLAQVLRRPNPYTTRYRLIEALVADMAIFDNALWAKVNTSDRQFGLVRLPPNKVTPKGTNPFTPDAYELAGDTGTRILTPDQVVHFRGYNPVDPRWGESPLESLRRILAEEAAAAEYREGLWASGARISGWISRPQGAPEWSDPARRRFRESWQGQYAGNGPRVGGTAILEDGMQFHEAGMTARDSQYIEARKLTREEVAAAYHIPPPMVGILDRATFSNITEQHKNLYQDTLGPWLEMIQAEIELQLLPDLGDPAREYVEFNMAEKLKGSFEEQADSMQKMVGRPVMTADEGRARLNLPSLGGVAAKLITPLNVSVDNEDGEPALGVTELATALQKIYLSVGKVITPEEAREILNREGAGLTGPAPELPDLGGDQS